MVTRTTGGPLDHMQVSQWQGAELVRHVVEQWLRVRVGRIVGRSDRREPQTYPVAAYFLYHGLHDFEQQAGAVLDRATISVGAVVRAAAQELVEQVPVGAVNFHAIKAGTDGAVRRVPVVGHDAGQLIESQCAWHRCCDKGGDTITDQQGFGLGGNGRRRHRRLPARLQLGVRDPPHMPQLDDHPAAGCMNRIGDYFPCRDLRFAPDSRHIDIALPLVADCSGLGDDQPRAGALGVIGCHQCRWHCAGRPIAGKWRHHDAVGECQACDLHGVEQRCHLVYMGAKLRGSSPFT